MDFIYEKVVTLLQEIPELKWVDLDKGQMEDYEKRPSISFPAALISIQLHRCEDIGAKRQNCQGLVSIRLVFDFTGNTDSTTPVIERTKSMSYFDVTKKVYQKLQGYKDTNINKFSRQNLREERRPDKYKVVVIPFTTSFIDSDAIA